MTKVRDLTGNGRAGERRIVFKKQIHEDGAWHTPVTKPDQWDSIDLICVNWRGCGMDLMRGYDERKNNGVLALGHFNDGVV